MSKTYNERLAEELLAKVKANEAGVCWMDGIPLVEAELPHVDRWAAPFATGPYRVCPVCDKLTEGVTADA